MAGCGTGFRYDGTWVGNRSLNLRDVDRYTAYTVAHVELEIKDGKFILTQQGMPYGGSVQSAGDRATLLVETFMKQPIAPGARQGHPPIELQAQPDGSLLLRDPATDEGKPVMLTRKTQPNS